MAYFVVGLISFAVGSVVGYWLRSRELQPKKNPNDIKKTGRVGLIQVQGQQSILFGQSFDMTIRVWVEELARLNDDLSHVKVIHASNHINAMKEFLEPYCETSRFKWYKKEQLPEFVK